MAIAEMLGGGSQQAAPMEKPMRWPLAAPMNQRQGDTPIAKDARLINGFAEYDATIDAYHIYKRPGYANNTALSIPGATTGLGLFSPASGFDLAVAVAAGVSHLYSGGIVQTGSAAGITKPCRFQDVNQGNAFVVFGDGGGYSTVYVWTSTGTAVQTLTSWSGGTFPPSSAFGLVPGFALLDGTFYVMDNAGNIWASNLNDITTWNALNVINAGQDKSIGMYLLKYQQYILAFKSLSVQPFYDAGNPTGSPLAPVSGANIMIGCVLPYSVQLIGTSCLWVGATITGAPQVVQMDNLTPKIVSTPAVEKILAKLGTNLAINWPSVTHSSGVIQRSGHRMYMLVLPSINLTLVYDLDQSLWYIWTDAVGNYWPLVSFSSSAIWATELGQHATNGKIYNIDDDYVYPNDDGVLFPVDIYTPNFTAGTTRRKMLGMMFPKGDQVRGSELLVRHSDDDYATWSNWRTINLGTKSPRLPNCGTFVKRALHLRHYKNTSFRLRDMELQYDVGTL